MKKLMFCLALAGLQALQVRDVREVTIEEFILQDQKATSDFIVMVPNGIDVPFHMAIKGDVITLTESAPITITTREELYFCKRDGEYLVSRDTKQWKTFSQFFTGNISAACYPVFGQLQAEISLDINNRV